MQVCLFHHQNRAMATLQQSVSAHAQAMPGHPSNPASISGFPMTSVPLSSGHSAASFQQGSSAPAPAAVITSLAELGTAFRQGLSLASDTPSTFNPQPSWSSLEASSCTSPREPYWLSGRPPSHGMPSGPPLTNSCANSGGSSPGMRSDWPDAAMRHPGVLRPHRQSPFTSNRGWQSGGRGVASGMATPDGAHTRSPTAPHSPAGHPHPSPGPLSRQPSVPLSRQPSMQSGQPSHLGSPPAPSLLKSQHPQPTMDHITQASPFASAASQTPPPGSPVHAATQLGIPVSPDHAAAAHSQPAHSAFDQHARGSSERVHWVDTPAMIPPTFSSPFAAAASGPADHHPVPPTLSSAFAAAAKAPAEPSSVPPTFASPFAAAAASPPMPSLVAEGGPNLLERKSAESAGTPMHHV